MDWRGPERLGRRQQRLSSGDRAKKLRETMEEERVSGGVGVEGMRPKVDGWSNTSGARVATSEAAVAAAVR